MLSGNLEVMRLSRKPSLRRQWQAALASAVLIGAVIVLLQVLAGAGLVSTFLVPSPAQIAARVPSLFLEERLIARLAETGVAVLVTVGLATAIGGWTGWVLSTGGRTPGMRLPVGLWLSMRRRSFFSIPSSSRSSGAARRR